MTLVTTTQQLSEHLRPEGATIAVIGFHPDTSRAAHYVPEYLHRRGFRVLPINPALAQRGEEYFGHKAAAQLADLNEAVDIVLIFRRSDKVAGHLDDILSLSPRPRLVWMQQGIRDPKTAATLVDAGIDVVQDRCMMVDHRSLT